MTWCHHENGSDSNNALASLLTLQEILMEQCIFNMLLIVEGDTEKVSQFILTFKSLKTTQCFVLINFNVFLNTTESFNKK